MALRGYLGFLRLVQNICALFMRVTLGTEVVAPEIFIRAPVVRASSLA
jgi:hypothetical protein